MLNSGKNQDEGNDKNNKNQPCKSSEHKGLWYDIKRVDSLMKFMRSKSFEKEDNGEKNSETEK